MLLALIQIIVSGLAFAASGNDDTLTQAKLKISGNLDLYNDKDVKYGKVQEYIEDKVMI